MLETYTLLRGNYPIITSLWRGLRQVNTHHGIPHKNAVDREYDAALEGSLNYDHVFNDASLPLSDASVHKNDTSVHKNDTSDRPSKLLYNHITLLN